MARPNRKDNAAQAASAGPSPSGQPALPGGNGGAGGRPKLTDMSRSGLRRYPRELADSLSEALGRPAAARIETPGRELVSAPVLESHQVGAAWLGHATVMLRIGGLNILTDPVFSSRIGVSVGPLVFGPARLGTKHIHVPTVPTPDLILISHAHFDHLDKPTLKRLACSGTTVVTAAKTKRLIPRGFANVIELGWGQTVEIRDPAGHGGCVRLEALQPAHWGARAAIDRYRSFNSYAITTPDQRHRALFAGDTAYTDAFHGRGPFDLAIFGIGAYDPWIHAHATPEQVWDMFTSLPAEYLLPMHHSTFKLSDEALDEPLARLLAAAGEQAKRVVGRELAEVWTK